MFSVPAPARQPYPYRPGVSAGAYADLVPAPMRGTPGPHTVAAMPSTAQLRERGGAAAPRTGGLAALRRGAAWLHLALALAIALGVFLQVYLIGAYIFGAGSDALDAHTSAGFTVHGFEVLTLIVALVAWLPRADVGLSLLMALLGTTQIALADAHGWTGGLHPLGALLVLVLATVMARRDLQRRRAAPA
jgi:hypothetical protein